MTLVDIPICINAHTDKCTRTYADAHTQTNTHTRAHFILHSTTLIKTLDSLNRKLYCYSLRVNFSEAHGLKTDFSVYSSHKHHHKTMYFHRKSYRHVVSVRLPDRIIYQLKLITLMVALHDQY